MQVLKKWTLTLLITLSTHINLHANMLSELFDNNFSAEKITITINNHTKDDFLLKYITGSANFDPQPTLLPAQNDQVPGTITTNLPKSFSPTGVITVYGSYHKFIYTTKYFNIIIKQSPPNRTQVIGYNDYNKYAYNIYEYNNTINIDINDQ